MPDTGAVNSLADGDTCLLGPGGVGKMCSEPIKLSLLAVKTEKYSVNQQVGNGSVPGRGQRSHRALSKLETGSALGSSLWEGWEGARGRERQRSLGEERALVAREGEI